MWWAFMFAAQNELFWRRPPFGSGSGCDQRRIGTLSRCANIGGTTPSENVRKCATMRSGRSFSHWSRTSIASPSRASMWSGARTSTSGRVLRKLIAFARAASRVSFVQLTLLSGRYPILNITWFLVFMFCLLRLNREHLVRSRWCVTAHSFLLFHRRQEICNQEPRHNHPTYSDLHYTKKK